MYRGMCFRGVCMYRIYKWGGGWGRLVATLKGAGPTYKQKTDQYTINY